MATRDNVKRDDASGESTGRSFDAAPIDPPDWSLVRFAVACPRCGRDVHGRTDPVCPDCALALDWSVLAPIEELTCPTCGYHLFGLTQQRCPECGGAFSWEEVVDGFRRRQKPLFEFNWRDAPLRWWLRAVGAAFRPWKLWRTIDIYDPTAVRGLMVLLAFTLLLSLVVPLLLAFPAHWLLEWLTGLSGAQFFRVRPWPYAPYMPMRWLHLIFVRSLIGACVCLVWLLGALGGLIVLRQSMAACRVRVGHVFRVCTYAVVPLACSPMIEAGFLSLSDTILAWLAIDPASSPLKDAVGRLLFSLNHGFGLPVLVLVLLVLSTISVATGYRYYIQMRHSWGVALSAQVIAAVTASIVYLRVISLF
ncbi:MAG: hypothetical protein ACE5E5_15790 [Phycisphaerae bacterium]